MLPAISALPANGCCRKTFGGYSAKGTRDHDDDDDVSVEGEEEAKPTVQGNTLNQLSQIVREGSERTESTA